MASAPDALVLDLVEWVAAKPRAYRDLIEAWRTSCPRLPVWEDAVDRGFLIRQQVPERGTLVVVTEDGREFLRAHGRRVRRTPQETANSTSW